MITTNYRLPLAIALITTLFSSALFSQETYEVGADPEFNPKFNNDRGLFRVLSGGVKNMHDTIGGKVEFNNRSQIEFSIPNSVYNKLFIIGPIRKNVRYRPGKEMRPIVVKDSLYIRDSIDYVNMNFQLQDVELDAKGNVVTDANIAGNRYVILSREDSVQSLESRNGSFDYLKINNPHGIDITDGANFTVRQALELARGEVRNELGNFVMADSSEIIRHPLGSILNSPVFENTVSVYYVGDTSLPITSGPELPDDSSALQTLSVKNKGGLFLDKTVIANDVIFVASFIETDKHNSNGDLLDSTIVLISTSGNNPLYSPDHPYAEIKGNLRHTNLSNSLADSLIYNNPYTWIKIEDPEELAAIKEITLRVRPESFPYYDKGDKKAKRFIVISALGLNGEEIDEINNLTLGYGWKHAKGDPLAKDYETNEMDVEDVVLERWEVANWHEFTEENPPQLTSDGRWAYGTAKNIGRLGFFAMGIPGDGIQLVFKALVLLEGPHLKDGQMHTALRDSMLIPTSPPDMYPYNLDPNFSRIQVQEIPQNVVDWLVLEFKNPDDTLYRTCFLKSDGSIVDIDGYSPVSLGKGNVDTGYYYISVRHRNHLAITTLNQVKIERDSVALSQVNDFSDPTFVAGGIGEALKPVKTNGGYIYTMIAGDSNAEPGEYGTVDYDNDIAGAWRNRSRKAANGQENDFEAYKTFLIFDYDMNGIITTKDLNISWNNQGKSSLIK